MTVPDKAHHLHDVPLLRGPVCRRPGVLRYAPYRYDRCQGEPLLPGKTKRRFWAKFWLSFSAYFSPMVPHLLFFCPHVYGIHLFLPISAYFLPKMVHHPCYKLKYGTQLPFFCPHVYRFRLFSTYVLLIFYLNFRPFSASPVLPGIVLGI